MLGALVRHRRDLLPRLAGVAPGPRGRRRRGDRGLRPLRRAGQPLHQRGDAPRPGPGGPGLPPGLPHRAVAGGGGQGAGRALVVGRGVVHGRDLPDPQRRRRDRGRCGGAVAGLPLAVAPRGTAPAPGGIGRDLRGPPGGLPLGAGPGGERHRADRAPPPGQPALPQPLPGLAGAPPRRGVGPPGARPVDGGGAARPAPDLPPLDVRPGAPRPLAGGDLPAGPGGPAVRPVALPAQGRRHRSGPVLGRRVQGAPPGHPGHGHRAAAGPGPLRAELRLVPAPVGALSGGALDPAPLPAPGAGRLRGGRRRRRGPGADPGWRGARRTGGPPWWWPCWPWEGRWGGRCPSTPS